MKNSLIGVVGLSHLGAVTSIGLASLGFRVIGFDPDGNTVGRLRDGDCIFPEPGLSGLLSAHRAHVQFTTDFSKLLECGVIVFGQDTVISAHNEMELDSVHSLSEKMLPHLREGVTVLFMSQVPVGFTRALQRHIRAQRKNFSFNLYYWVDILIVGDAVSRFLKPGRITVGLERTSESLNEASLNVLNSLKCPIIKMNFESAEMTKSAMNVYLATTVTFANELAALCEAVGADMSEIVPALRLDKRVGPYAYIKPGLGFSGGHLERDVVALLRLARAHSLNTDFFELLKKQSESRYQWLFKKIKSVPFAKNSLPTIAMWGVSYKKNTDSTHGAPSMQVIRDFAKHARIVSYDPLVKLPSTVGVETVDEKYKALEKADCLLILSDWDEFKDIDLQRVRQHMNVPVIIDPLGVLADINFEGSDIQYFVTGRGVYE